MVIFNVSKTYFFNCIPITIFLITKNKTLNSNLPVFFILALPFLVIFLWRVFYFNKSLKRLLTGSWCDTPWELYTTPQLLFIEVSFTYVWSMRRKSCVDTFTSHFEVVKNRAFHFINSDSQQ